MNHADRVELERAIRAAFPGLVSVRRYDHTTQAVLAEATGAWFSIRHEGSLMWVEAGYGGPFAHFPERQPNGDPWRAGDADALLSHIRAHAEQRAGYLERTAAGLRAALGGAS